MSPTRRLVAHLFLTLAAASPAQAYTLNDWTGAAGNNLWGDPANWTQGVPASDHDVTIANSAQLVDLGGQRWTATNVVLNSSQLHLVNGTLVTRFLFSDATSSSDATTVTASLTSESPLLTIGGPTGYYDKPLRIEGPIVGDAFTLSVANTVLAAANTHTGPTLPYDATFADNGSARNSSAFELTGGLLTLDNTAVNLDDRLNDAAPVRLRGGRLYLIANAAAPTTERVGALELLGPGGSVGFRAAGIVHSATLRAASLVRQDHALGHLDADPAYGTRVLFDTAPQLAGGGPGAGPTARGILPYLWSDAADDAPLLVTYDTGNPADPAAAPGIRRLDPATEYEPSLPTTPAPAAPNVRLATTQTHAGDATVNSLSVGRLAVLTLDRGATLTVNGGALAGGRGSRITGDGAITVPGEAIFHGQGFLDVPLHARSLVLGAGPWVLGKANDLPDGVTINGTVTLQHPDALGAGPVQFPSDGRISFSSSQALANDLTFGGGRELVSGTAGTLQFSIPQGQTLTLIGHLSGDFAIFEVNTGRLRIDGDGAFPYVYATTSGPARSQGSLEINGTISPTPDRSWKSLHVDGQLAGTGTFLGSADAGLVSPGHDAAPGRLTLAALGNATLSLDLDGPTPAADYDQLVLLQAFTGDTAALTVDLTFTPSIGQSFLIVDNRFAGPVPHPFTNLPEGATLLTPNNTLLQISYAAGDGNDISLTTIPEPTTILPLAACALTLLLRRRHQRKVPG